MKKLFVLSIFLLAFALVSCSNQNDQQQNKQSHSSIIKDSSAVVKDLDVNKDGKVFQCPMQEHFNIISDVPTTCPKCEMDLVEVDDSTAQKNLYTKFHPTEFEEKL